MGIQKAEVKRFAKLIAEEFLSDKTSADLQGVTQDHIDAFVIPVMTEVEDVVNVAIAEKVKASFNDEPLGEEDEWWRRRQE